MINITSTGIVEDYIALLKKTLTGLNRIDRPQFKPRKKISNNLFECDYIEQSLDKRLEGLDWPLDAETMIGIKRIENVEFCIKEILRNNIEGDFIETGVWRGGTCIFMRGLLKAFGNTDRIVWVADSFQGLPMPNKSVYPHDAGDILYTYNELKISEEDVKTNFRKYGLLDDQVKFLKGWFKDTMPLAPIKKLSLLRLDGDMYESTIDVLIYMYPKLSNGGFCIVDDWGAIPACKKAVEDYRLVNDLNEEIITIDWTGVYWKKTKEVESFTREDFFKTLAEKEAEESCFRINEFKKKHLLKSFDRIELIKEDVLKKNIENLSLIDESLSFDSLNEDPYFILPLLQFEADKTYNILIDITVEEITKVQVFYLTDTVNKYNEEHSVRSMVKIGRQSVIIELLNNKLSGRLRIDTGAYRGRYIVHSIEVRESTSI